MSRVTVAMKAIGPKGPQEVKFVLTPQLADDEQAVQLYIGEDIYTIKIDDLLTFARAITPLK